MWGENKEVASRRWTKFTWQTKSWSPKHLYFSRELGFRVEPFAASQQNSATASFSSTCYVWAWRRHRIPASPASRTTGPPKASTSKANLQCSSTNTTENIAWMDLIACSPVFSETIARFCYYMTSFSCPAISHTNCSHTPYCLLTVAHLGFRKKKKQGCGMVLQNYWICSNYSCVYSYN